MSIKKGNPPLVSIITVVKNCAEGMSKTLASIRNQKTMRMEYIVVDGGSTDGTVEIIKSNQDIISHWVSKEDLGIFYAMNKGFKLSRGNWIWFINADDYLQADAFNQVIKAVNHLPPDIDILYGALRRIGEGYECIVNERNLHNLNKDITFNHPATLVSRSLFLTLGGFDTRYHIISDYDFFTRAVIRKSKVFYLNRVLTNMSYGGMSERLGNFFIRVKEKFHIDLKNFNLFYALKAVFFYHCFGFVKKILRIILENIGLKFLIRLYFKQKYKKS